MPYRKKALFSFVIFALFVTTLFILFLPHQATADTPLEKVSWQVLADTQDGQTAHFLVALREQADVSGAAGLPTKQEKGAYVTRVLRETAARTQPAVMRELEALGASYRGYWISNMIAVEGNRQVVEAMARHQAVAKLSSNRAVTLEGEPELDPSELEPSERPANPSAVEWGVQQINAPDVWTMGYKGSDIVVADQDTGFQWDHPALVNQYRGWDGSAADHNYHWWDAIHEDLNGNGTNSCGFSSLVPCDDQGHGTHTAGTIVGSDGDSNQIGVAPEAKWIGCRNMESGVGRPSTYTECFQFFMAPHDLNGDNPDSSLAPDVVSNSWGCPLGAPPGGEDCAVDSFKTTIENMRAAGIMIVVSAGNSGSSCSTLHSPPAYLDAATSVGATSSSDVIASFSSRGPVTRDGSNRLKPDISAPGVSVRSSRPGNSYGLLSGTSMAAPHVAGAVALLLNARPTLKGNVDEIEEALFSTATERTTTQNCGGILGSTIPNNTYGYGRLDILSAVNAGSEVNASITFTKTVGIAASTCAESNQLELSDESEVTYCYTVTNSGNITFTSHTLVDDQLGTLLSDESYELLPGASRFVTATTTITESTVYTATWSAVSNNNLQANAAASAAITLSVPSAISLSDIESTSSNQMWRLALPIGLVVALGLLFVLSRRLDELQGLYEGFVGEVDLEEKK